MLLINSIFLHCSSDNVVNIQTMSVNLWIGVEVELGRIKLSKYYLVDKIRNRIRCESFKTKQKQIEIFISDKVNYILKLIVITIN